MLRTRATQVTRERERPHRASGPGHDAIRRRMQCPTLSASNERAAHMTVDPASAIAIALGAAFGALARWLLTLALAPMSTWMPLGTLAANLGGCLLMGIVLGLAPAFTNLSMPVQLALTTGFLGGLTTFSAFSGETIALALRGEWAATAAIVALHVGGSLLATMLGVGLVRLFARA